MLSGRGLCDELITRPEESYRLCCVVVCDLETSRIGAPYIYIYIYIYDISSLRVKILQYCRETVLFNADRNDITDAMPNVCDDPEFWLSRVVRSNERIIASSGS